MSKPRAPHAVCAVALSLLLGACGWSSTKTVSEAEAATDTTATAEAATADAATADAATAPAATLSKSEAEALFANAKQHGTTATGVTYVTTYKPDGTATLEWNYLTTSGRDIGTWRVADDGAICKTWSQTDGGVEQCERVASQGDGTYRSIDAATGLDRATFTIETVV